MGYKVHIMRFVEAPDCPLAHQIESGAVTVHGRKASDKNNEIQVGDKILLQVHENNLNTSVLEVEVTDIKQYGDVEEFVFGEGLDAILGDRTKCMNIKDEKDYANFYSKMVDAKEIRDIKKIRGYGFIGFHIRFIHRYQILRKNVQDPWFTHIKNGDKRVEGRLNKSWVATLQRMDRIIWNNSDQRVSTIVKDIKSYASFREMIEKEGIQNVLPGVKSIEEGVKVYRKFYSESDEKKFGVVGIHLGLLKN